MSSSGSSLTEQFRGYLDRGNPNLLGKVDFGAIIGDASRATIAAVFVGIATVVVAIGRGFNLVVRTLEFAVTESLLAIGLSPQVILQPAQATTAGAVSELGFAGLPVAAGTQLLSIGIVAFVIVLAWGSG